MNDSLKTEIGLIEVGTRLDSIYGDEHRGTVVEVTAFKSDGKPTYHVRRDSDGFVWLGSPVNVRPVNRPAVEGGGDRG